ncbi:agmatinase family protein [Marivirga harenae]|uniref:agmatinase family protein n=1 Tax=Marivirga harenae TaxID=2010992 RepID=UPI0026DF590A|nr:agmatinase family protein [Marivirga harenae]WKV10796.1 agmatinase family protein [Marivirga harenae]|tara:strand:- start:58910 stop:59983 length:1074 start_codon:yes stop_codon:yes gene_type:complete
MSKKQDLINAFDPNGLGNTENIFGLPFDEKTADLILLPVPWEVTVSYAAGTAQGPQHILEASTQVDLYQKDIIDAWQLGIQMLPIDQGLLTKSNKNRILAEEYIGLLEAGEENSEKGISLLKDVNSVCAEMVDWVKSKSLMQLEKRKLLGLVGGDHSTPLGAVQALATQHESFGVLQIDAHMDFRKAYENFDYSHASISYNMLQTVPQIEKMVQVGIRDFCEEEIRFAEKQGDRVNVFYDDDIKVGMFEGESWTIICDRIIKELPNEVYITFDIDGLRPELCPNTGTPVPGGISYSEIIYLLTRLVKNGKKIIGFDLNEVAPGENTDWNGNVGARILYRLCNLMGVSQGKLDWDESF